MAEPVDNTGPRKIIPTAGDGDQYMAGKVESVTGIEMRPCVMCRSFDKDERKLTSYLRSRGMTINPDGTFETPIAKDLPGMKSMRLQIAKFGWCQQDCHPVEDLATCEKWSQRRDLRGLVK